MSLRTTLLYHLRSLRYSTLRSLKSQMIVTLCTLPVLAAWGLPFSVLTPLGNIIFTPFFIVILLFASLLFFTELLHLPNSWIAVLLDWSMRAYQYCLAWSHSSVMISLKTPSFGLFCASMTCVAALIHHKRIWLHRYHLLIYTVACGLLLMLLHKTPQSSAPVYQLPCKRAQLTLITDQQSLFIIDNGALGSIPNGHSYIEYTLIPAMRSRYGTQQIDHLIILQYNTWTMQALEQLCALATVKNIYIPSWKVFCLAVVMLSISSLLLRQTRKKHGYIICAKNQLTFL